MPQKRFHKKIVIYGGAFSPPHIGHAATVEVLVRSFPCDEIWIMPSGQRSDKKITASGEHRINMLKIMRRELFSKSKVPIKISSFEISRKGLTKTFETKQALEQCYPKYEFHFVIGTELIPQIKSWEYGHQLYRTAQFVAVHRPNTKIFKKIPSNFTILENIKGTLAISSTFIRNLIAEGHSAIPYTTPAIARYLKKYKLYRAT